MQRSQNDVESRIDWGIMESSTNCILAKCIFNVRNPSLL